MWICPPKQRVSVRRARRGAASIFCHFYGHSVLGRGNLHQGKGKEVQVGQTCFGYVLLSNARRVRPITHGVILISKRGVATVIRSATPYRKCRGISLGNNCLVPNLVGLRIRLTNGNGPDTGPQSGTTLIHEVLDGNLAQTITCQLIYDCTGLRLLNNIAAVHAINNLTSFSAHYQSSTTGKGVLTPHVLTTGRNVSIPNKRVTNSITITTRGGTRTLTRLHETNRREMSLIGLVVANNILSTARGNAPKRLGVGPRVIQTIYSRTRELNCPITTRARSPRKIGITLRGNISSVRRNTGVSRRAVQLCGRQNTFIYAAVSPTLPCTLFSPTVSNTSRGSRCGNEVIFSNIIRDTEATLTGNVPINLNGSINYPCIARCSF